MTFALRYFSKYEVNFCTKIIKFPLYCSTSKLSTIFSLSSGQGKCGVAVIRVSGPESKAVFHKISNFPENESIQPRFAYLRRLKHPQTHEIIDRGLCLWFPGPKSFTGEDCCEFQVHGGPAIIVALLDALNSMKGLRAAKPGEFTKRAFYAGKMDLTEVEGLADLIHAETEQQRKQALIQADGSLSKLYDQWRTKLIRCLAHIEAFIDFAEDENIESDTLTTIEKELNLLETEVKSHVNDGRRGEMLRHGVRTVIIGAPNVGKSSFMNEICQKPISIVTDIAGTTRDVIERSFNVSGYPVVLADTAGLRKDAKDIVEMEGISRTRKCVELSDLVILVMNAIDVVQSPSVSEYKINYLKSMGLREMDLEMKNVLPIINKIDLISEAELSKLQENNEDIAFISCKNGAGISAAVSNVSDRLKNLCGEPNVGSPNLSQQRHRHLLEECLTHMNEFQCRLENGSADLAISAQYLRCAIRCLGEISGHVNSEEILDVIFRDFCIGK
ncbi:tRNA modification GTPase GTPBP3, mitochondrial [Pseudolycoriella hygida]|uniref:tRNA modification GTPase GTPBP3, mitochondrial n=1 Tax=Pseudolycoriella hygida TaxID=35572 RepID=A0A9Q0RXJ0_9DIPT|nr:tRNA modification GTPase GTPBP3, mitochondrial [Pseudolycoriella hygida]